MKNIRKKINELLIDKNFYLFISFLLFSKIRYIIFSFYM